MNRIGKTCRFLISIKKVWTFNEKYMWFIAFACNTKCFAIVFLFCDCV